MKRLYASILAVSIFYCSHAQFFFGQYMTPVVNGHSVTAADIDSDGHLDLLVASQGTFNNQTGQITNPGKLAWFKNLNGKGHFGTEIQIPITAQSARFVQAADLDGDGDQDIVCTLFSITGPNGLFVFKNIDGQGDFNSGVNLSSDGQSTFLLGDIDYDGDIDIVQLKSGEVVRYRNTGQGNFSPAEVLFYNNPAASQGGSMILADMDGDGYKDLVVLTSSTSPAMTKVSWYRNNFGYGFFVNEKIIATSADSQGSLAAGDLDGDGDQDIVISFQYGGVAWYENLDGAGNFGSGTLLSNLSSIRGIHIADIDLDSDLDIVVSSFYDGRAVYFSNLDGAGAFGPGIRINPPSLPAYPLSSGVIDLDGDGDLDYFYSGHSLLAWFENNTIVNDTKIAVSAYFDENENGVCDDTEKRLQGQSFTIDPVAMQVWGVNQSEYQYIIYQAGPHSVACHPRPGWEFTTEPAIALNIPDSIYTEYLEFGLKPVISIPKVYLTINSGPTRCGFTVPFWLQITNTGTLTSSGLVYLDLDSLVTFSFSNPPPDSIAGNRLYWNIQDIFPSHTQTLYLSLIMPDANFLGEWIALHSEMELTDSLGAPLYLAQHDYISQINCAYDPNDKLTRPQLPGTPNYTLFSDSLVYTIRFQNTGTDTAFLVRILDQLSPLLDWSSFSMIASSHPCEVSLSDEGRLTFLFNPIFLPHKAVNEIGSQGFVQFSIHPENGLAEETEILNQAQIYFDYNSPITTNNASNLMVSKFPLDVIVTPVNCFDSQTGSIIVETIDTSPVPLLFLWDNGMTGDSLLNVPSGDYQLTVVFPNGQVVSDTSVFIATPEPIELILSSSPADDATGTATVEVYGGTPPFMFSWSTQPPQSGPLAFGLTSGHYEVEVIDANGCKASAGVFVDQILNTGEHILKWGVSAQPNPSFGDASVHISLEAPMLWNLQVWDAQGKLHAAFTGHDEQKISLIELPAGIYFIKFQAGGSAKALKLVVIGRD